MTELITNGSFDTDTTGWSSFNASLSAVNGLLRVTSSGSGAQVAYQSFATEAGKRYRIAADVIRGSSSHVILSVGNGATTAKLANSVSFNDGVGQAATFVAENTTTYVRAQLNSNAPAGQFSDFDNISVQALPPRKPARSSFVLA